MYLTKEKRKDLIKKYSGSEIDTGNILAQISIFTFRINYLSVFLKSNKKDYNTKRSLIKIVGKRKKLLRYIEKTNIENYKNIIKNLSIRK